MERQVKEDISDIDSFDLPKNKKKKKKKKKQIQNGSLDKFSEEVTTSLSSIHIYDDEDEEEEEGKLSTTWYLCEGAEGDYGYEKLLGRVFNALRENNPKLSGDKRRAVLRPPEVHQDGTKNTILVNFMDLCKTMHRHPKHFMTFLLNEMDTSGSLDGQDRLVVKGRFASKNVEVMLRKYIDEYVICHTCKSPDTILTHEGRLFVIGCDQCGSERSATPITTGSVARVDRRKFVDTI